MQDAAIAAIHECRQACMAKPEAMAALLFWAIPSQLLYDFRRDLFRELGAGRAREVDVAGADEVV